MAKSSPAENDIPPLKPPSQKVANPFSRMRVRYLLGWLIFAVIVILIFFFIIGTLGPDPYPESSLRELLIHVIAYFVILLSVWIYLRRNRVSWTRLRGPVPRQSTCFGVFKVVPLLIAFSLGEGLVLVYSLSHLAPGIFDELLSVELFVTAANEQQQWAYDLVMMFQIVVLVPVAEEALFRGLMLHRWAVRWNLTAALWTSSILFGIGHTQNVIGGTVFGLVMAILYIETGSLLVPVVVHATNNAIWCLIEVSGRVLPSWVLPDAWSGAADIRDMLWLGILLLGVSVPLMFLYISRHWPRKSIPLPYFRDASERVHAPQGRPMDGKGASLISRPVGFGVQASAPGPGGSMDETGRYPKMAASKTLYLANPYGFSAQQREGPLAALVAALEALGAEVWEPFSRNNQIDPANSGWAYRIGQADLRDVRNADGMFAVVNGCPPDEGVMVELGMAIAWEKPVFLFRDDFRRCTDSEAYPLNLMVFAGLPEEGWQAYWYSSIEEIADPGKTLARWLNDGAPALKR